MRQGVEHALLVVQARETRRDADEVLEHGRVRGGRPLGLALLDGDGRLRGHCGERLQAAWGGATAVDRLVEGEEAERLTGGGDEWRDQRIHRPPRIGVRDDRQLRRVHRGALVIPLDAALGNEVHALHLERLVEDPAGPSAGHRGADERVLAIVAADDGRDDVVVVGRAVQVERGDAEAHRGGRGLGDGMQEVLEARGGAAKASEADEPIEGAERAGRQVGGTWAGGHLRTVTGVFIPVNRQSTGSLKRVAARWTRDGSSHRTHDAYRGTCARS